MSLGVNVLGISIMFSKNKVQIYKYSPKTYSCIVEFIKIEMGINFFGMILANFFASKINWDFLDLQKWI